MVREENGIIILDNGVSVLPVFNDFCFKCKKNLSPNGICTQCRIYSYEYVVNLGYYHSRWFYKDDRYIRSDIIRTYDLNLVNPKYRFSKLINDAKRRFEYNTISDKKDIIKILSKGFAWKMKKDENELLNKIDIIVHIPKKDEDPKKDELDKKYFNHGYCYAEYISNELGIPFNDKLIYEHEDSVKGNRKFGILGNFNVKNKIIMIIDDTYTRGDTKGPISDLVKEVGASLIYIGVIGRSMV